MKIAGSDYFLLRKGNGNIEEYRARQVFFLSTRIHAPGVLVSLKNKAFPIYNQLFPEDYSSTCGTLNLKRLRWNKIEAVNTVCKNHLTPLIEIINKWSERHNLVDDWIIDKALITLAYWRESPPTPGEKLSWHDDAKLFIFANPIPKDQQISSFVFSFAIKGWNPFLEPWKKAEGRIISKVKEILEKGHQKERETLAKDLAIKLGYVKARKKRQIEKHMRWLIEYQIHNKTSGEIRIAEISRKKQYDEYQIYQDEENKNTQNDDQQKYNNEKNKRKDRRANTIKKEINDTAELIKLTLRKKFPNK